MAISAFVIAVLGIIGAEVILPTLTGGGLIQLLTIDTADKFALTLGAERTIEQTIIFFNVTNARELQDGAGARPKPVFQEVRVPFVIKTSAFDYEPSSNGETYAYKTWSSIAPKHASDGLLEIVQINAMLPLLVGQLGGEATIKATHDAAAGAGAISNSSDPQILFATGCATLDPAPLKVQFCMMASLMYVGLATEQALGLKPDGTGALGVGLFVRRTVNQMVNGFSPDPLTQMPNPGSTVGYNLYQTQASLEAALAAGTEQPGKFTSVKRTGKGDPTEIGKWVSLKTFSNISMTTNNPFWLVPPTGYSTQGPLNGEPFVISGLHSSTQPMAPLAEAPSVYTAGYPPKATPSAGQHLSFFEDVFTFRSMSYSCGACEHESLHGVNLVKYVADESNGYLKKDGVHDAAGACALTSTCDYGSLQPSLWTTTAATYSLPYFGNSSTLLTATATFKDAQGQVLSYDDATMRNELYIEPFSGAPLKVRSMTQVNLHGVSALLFNGGMYSKMFSAPLPPVWPVTLSVTDFEASADQANLIASPLNLAYLLMLLSNVIALVFFMVGTVITIKLMRSPAKTTPKATGKGDGMHKKDEIGKTPGTPNMTMDA